MARRSPRARACAHWLNVFDWRALEARLNREAHVTTEIDGLTIHAMMRRSPRPDALPLLILHGWPSSFLEFLDIYEPLTNPPPGVQAFHVVTPSLPGYGFSTTRPGVTTQAVAPLMATLSDWGSLMATEIARQFPDRLLGLLFQRWRCLFQN